MIHDGVLRQAVETARRQAKAEWRDLEGKPPDPAVEEARRVLEARLREAELLLGMAPRPAKKVAAERHRPFPVMLVAIFVLIFALVWGIFALTTKHHLNAIDTNLHHLIERYSEEGLKGP